MSYLDRVLVFIFVTGPEDLRQVEMVSVKRMDTVPHCSAEALDFVMKFLHSYQCSEGRCHLMKVPLLVNTARTSFPRELVTGGESSYQHYCLQC